MGHLFAETGLIFLKTILAIAFLYKGADLLIDSALKTASKLNISEILISVTLIAWATSLPEFFVLVEAIKEENGSTFAYGTILGSNFANICLVLGLSLFLKFGARFSFDFNQLKSNYSITLASALIFAIYGLNIIDNAVIKKMLSVLMISGMTIYVFKLSKETPIVISENADKNLVSNFELCWKIALSVILLIIGSNVLVDNGLELQKIGFSSSLIGSFYFALSTSSPEIFSSIVAIFKYKKNDIVIGNILGSNLANISIFGFVTLFYTTESVNFSFESPILLLALELSLFLVFMGYYLRNKKIPTLKIHSFIGYLLFFVYYLFYKAL